MSVEKGNYTGKTPFWKKSFKKTFYKVQTRSWNRVIAFALVIGILAGALNGMMDIYQNHPSSYAHVSIVYPQIANGKYPDGSRFTTYDLLAEDRIQEALDAMQAKGEYEDITVEQLAEKFEVRTYTEGSVAEDVSSLRSEGNNYSYFANEYRLTFYPPYDGFFLNVVGRLQEAENSEGFLNELMQAINRNIQKHYGGANGFSEMTNIGDISAQDYAERVGTYRTQIGIILRYLKAMNGNSGGFQSATTGKDLMDLISNYEVLHGERLNQIENFIQTSGVTTDLETLINKLRTRLETQELSVKKLNDQVEVNRYAMNTYDHTFTENLIVVSTSDTAGLYQARPRTAFDTVVNQFNDVVNSAIEGKAKMGELNREISLYTSVSRQGENYQRLITKCEDLLKNFEDDYRALGEVAAATMADYLSERNEQYISYKVGTNKLDVVGLLKKSMVVAVGVAVAVFVVWVLIGAIMDLARVRRKHRKLNRMRSYRSKMDAEK